MSSVEVVAPPLLTSFSAILLKSLIVARVSSGETGISPTTLFTAATCSTVASRTLSAVALRSVASVCGISSTYVQHCLQNVRETLFVLPLWSTTSWGQTSGTKIGKSLDVDCTLPQSRRVSRSVEAVDPPAHGALLCQRRVRRLLRRRSSRASSRQRCTWSVVSPHSDLQRLDVHVPVTLNPGQEVGQSGRRLRLRQTPDEVRGVLADHLAIRLAPALSEGEASVASLRRVGFDVFKVVVQVGVYVRVFSCQVMLVVSRVANTGGTGGTGALA